MNRKMKVEGVGYEDWEKDESSEKKNLSLEEEGNMKRYGKNKEKGRG